MLEKRRWGKAKPVKVTGDEIPAKKSKKGTRSAPLLPVPVTTSKITEHVIKFSESDVCRILRAAGHKIPFHATVVITPIDEDTEDEGDKYVCRVRWTDEDDD